jgi:hypothetical protein
VEGGRHLDLDLHRQICRRSPLQLGSAFGLADDESHLLGRLDDSIVSEGRLPARVWPRPPSSHSSRVVALAETMSSATPRKAESG